MTLTPLDLLVIFVLVLVAKPVSDGIGVLWTYIVNKAARRLLPNKVNDEEIFRQRLMELAGGIEPDYLTQAGQTPAEAVPPSTVDMEPVGLIRRSKLKERS